MKKSLIAATLLVASPIASHAAGEVLLAPSDNGAVWVFAGGTMYYCVPGNPPQCREAETVSLDKTNK
jgi:hypothetical protein